MKTLTASLAAAAATLTLDARAVDFSDLWWNPAESGWGANVVQQGENAFVTIFVYGANGEPLWLVSPDARVYAYSAAGLPQFRGTLYKTTGAAFSGPFDPGATQATALGTLYLSPTADNALTLDYNVNNIAVRKALTRQTFAQNIDAANYTGTFRLRQSMPGQPPYGTREYSANFLMVHNEAGELVMRIDEPGYGLCDFRGPYVQNGRYGAFAGSYHCANGNAGTFEVTRLQVTDSGVTGQMRTVGPDGLGIGRFGAVRQ